MNKPKAEKSIYQNEVVDLTFSDEEAEKESRAIEIVLSEGEDDDCVIISSPNKKPKISKLKLVTPDVAKSSVILKSSCTTSAVKSAKRYQGKEVLTGVFTEFIKITSRIRIDAVKTVCHNKYCKCERSWMFNDFNRNFTLGQCPNCKSSPGRKGTISLGGYGAFVKEDNDHVRMVNPPDYTSEKCMSALTIGVAVANGKLVVVFSRSIKLVETPSSLDSKLPASL
mmetsp:Transcript_25606/g.39671  ORF Transcript_25606/g.39671 Transcript_25606/m.39671 type:complete len:225 (+) Transcript_25606:288-962(+)